MDKKTAFKWAKALESGKYKQGFNRLMTINKETGECSFCALGVLCETMGIKYKRTDLVLGENALRILKIKHNNGRYVKNLEQGISFYNDYDRFDFRKIAQIIRRDYKLL